MAKRRLTVGEKVILPADEDLGCPAEEVTVVDVDEDAGVYLVQASSYAPDEDGLEEISFDHDWLPV